MHRCHRLRCSETEYLHPPFALWRRGRLVELQSDPVLRIDTLDPQQVGDRAPGREVLLVGLRERVVVEVEQPGRLRLAEHLVSGPGQVVLPGPGGIGDPLLERGDVDVRHDMSAGRSYDVMQPGADRLADPGGE